jgi:hypothetical protein
LGHLSLRNAVRFEKAARSRNAAEKSAFLFTALCFLTSQVAYADDVSKACAKSPYKTGDLATRYGPRGDDYYNTLRIVTIYLVPGKNDAAWCSLGAPGSCGPEPPWYQKTAGWLYKVRGKGYGNGRTFLWYANGYEMDGTLDYLDTPLATFVVSHSVRCTQ